MESMRERFDRSLEQLFVPGSDIQAQMTETTHDTEMREYISRHFQRLQQIATAQEVERSPESADHFLDALARGQDRALCALVRLAFEAGRLDERAEAATLNALLNGLEE